MKNRVLGFIYSLLIASSITTAVAADTFNGQTILSDTKLSEATINGPANLTNITAESLKVVGPLHFKNLTVNGNAHITGPVTGEKGKFGKLEVMGALNITHVSIKALNITGTITGSNISINEDTTIIGALNVKDSKFKNIIITSDEIKLTNGSADSILIKSKKYTKPVLTLDGTSIIKGDITFETGNGTIVLGKKAKINGKIVGGKVAIEK